MQFDPESPEGKKKLRQKQLRKAGVSTDQALVVLTLRQLTGAYLQKLDEAVYHYAKLWAPAECLAMSPEIFKGWVEENKLTILALKRTKEALTNKETLTHGIFSRKFGIKKAFDVSFTVTPRLDAKGNPDGTFRFDVDHVEVPWPANVPVDPLWA